MRILVPVKQVARLKEGHLPDGAGRLDPEALEWSLNEWDGFALEAAQQLFEASGEGEGEVVVVSVGEVAAEEGLRTCLARGANRAIRVWEEGLEGVDPLAVARVLAAVAHREQPELILCGAQSSDGASGATGAALAGLLGWARVAVVDGIELDGEDLTVRRELEGGAIEVLRLSLPALLTIQTGIDQPRQANLRAIKLARSRPLEVLTLGELELSSAEVSAAAGSRRVRLIEPERSERAEMLEGSPAEIAKRILELTRRELGS